MKIERPKFIIAPLADGLRWRGGAGWRYEEKMDGVWAVRRFGPAILCGEAMRDSRFFAFDVVSAHSQDVRGLPLALRLALLSDLERGECAGMFQRPAVGQGGEFLEAVLARGGEGVVAKELAGPFGALWWKCTRLATFDLIVTEKATDGRSSIRVGELNGEDRGWCPCRSEFEKIRVGDIVEIAAHSLTKNGKLREPRFVRPRPDKR